VAGNINDGRLLDRAPYAGEDIACVRSNQPDCGYRYCQNDSEHYRVLGDILARILMPRSSKKGNHSFRLVAPSGQHTAPIASKTQWPIGVVYTSREHN
jgi:hypothetical protein